MNRKIISIDHISGKTSAYIYVFILSSSTIYVDYLGDIFNIYSLLFFSTLIAYLFFNIANWGEIKKSHASIITSPFLWAVTSVTILIAWWASYFVTIHASPSFCMATSFLSLGLLASIYKGNINKSLLCGISIFLCYILSPKASLTTLMIAIGGGASMYFYARYSNIFSKHEDLSSINVLSIRFYPLLICSFSLFIFNTGHSLLLSDHASLNIFLVILYLSTNGVFNRVFPMFFSQQAIHMIGSELASFIFSLIPITTFILQGIFERKFPLLLFLATMVATMSLNFDKIIRTNKKV